MHGFAASAEQWQRLVHQLRAQAGGEPLPPVYALDLLGFGMSEKPGLSYTQYVWEAQARAARGQTHSDSARRLVSPNLA